jgi:hypothetical protein
MHLPTRAGPRRRTRSSLLAAALTAAVAAFALPAAAHAGDISVSNTGQLSYIDGSSRENNRVLLRVEGNEIVITDAGAQITSSSLACQVVNPNRAECPANLGVSVFTLGGADTVEYRLPHAGFVDLGVGNDTVIAGRREAAGFAIRPVTYTGGPNADAITYGQASHGVSLTPEDGLANDGRPGDQENVGADFETIIGSAFDDAPLFGTPGPDVMFGFGGRDSLGGGGGDDQFISLNTVDGADDYHGGPGRDTMDYSGRSQPLTVLLDNVANDGAAGEGDQVRSNVENVIGGSAADTLRSFGAFSRLEGRGGVDTLIGDGGPDTLIGGAAEDIFDAGSGDDFVDANDGVGEVVACGSGTDSFRVDSRDGISSCETPTVGILRLTPATMKAQASQIARLKLSWRHPVAWKQLDRIELRLTRDQLPVGEVTIRPRGGRISDRGAVEVMRTGTRLTRSGKTVTARLAVRLDGSVAGATLKAEVEATDTRGRRQLERDAATVRVAG